MSTKNTKIEKEVKQETVRSRAPQIFEVINGNFLSKDNIQKHIPFILFLFAVSLVYIANGYMAENTVRKINARNNELKELRSEYISTKSELMYHSKQSGLVDIIQSKNLGLKESFVPPKKITVTKKELKQIQKLERSGR